MYIKTGLVALLLSLAMVLGWSGAKSAHAQQTVERALELFNRGSYAQALEMFQNLANRDSVEAHYQLGRIYSEGDSVQRDFETAAVFLRRAALDDHRPAQLLLAELYLAGEVPSLDQGKANQEALELLMSSADGGVPEAAMMVAVLLDPESEDPAIGVIPDPEVSFAYLRQAAASGVGEAQFRMGNYHVEREEYEQAISFYTEAANSGNAAAFYNLGVLSFYGRGVSRSDFDAGRYFQDAAELGHGRAQNHLAWMYRHGRGVVQSDSQAAKYYYSAAEKGFPDAQNQIALALLQGRGVQANSELAVAFMTDAARQGHLNSVYNLGLMYLKGLGVPRDLKKAYELLQLAAGAGLRRASARLPVLVQQANTEGEILFEDPSAQSNDFLVEPEPPFLEPTSLPQLTLELPIDDVVE